MMMFLAGIVSAFVAAVAISVYAYYRNPTILGTIGTGGAGALGGWWVDSYSAFSARLADGISGAGSTANVLLAVGMFLMLGVMTMNAIVTALDGKKNNFSLIR